VHVLGRGCTRVVSGDKTPEGVGKVWMTSGVSVGTNWMIAWIAAMHGGDVADAACDWMEYRGNRSDGGTEFAKFRGYRDAPFNPKTSEKEL
jgi:hypothetical protein